MSSLGICDLRENVPERWEFELNQIAVESPRVHIVKPEEVFDCDVFLFCASRFVPDVQHPVRILIAFHQRGAAELVYRVADHAEHALKFLIVKPEEVFDCDVFLFCASRFVPDTAVKSGRLTR